MRLRVVASAGMVLGFLLLAAVASGFYPDQAVGRGNAQTWVMNLHETLEANVVVSFLDQDGFQTRTMTSTIKALSNDSFPASSSGLSSGWLGSVTVDSLRPIASVEEAVWQDVPAHDHWTGAAFTDFSEGAQDIFFPALSKTERQKSIVTIQCLDTEDCEVEMTYRDRDGNVITGSPFADTIEAYSQESYDLWDPSLNPHIPDQQYTPDPWYGSLQVVSPQKVAGAVVTHWHLGYAAAYNSAAVADDTKVYFPSVKRRKFTDTWGGNSDWSALTVQNLNDFTVTAHLYFYDRDGNELLQFTDDIPAYSSHAYNTRYGGSVPASTFLPLGDRFLGSAIVTATSPILGVCNLVRGPTYLASWHNGVPGGAQTLAFPVAYRTMNDSAWTGYSGVIVHNLDAQNEITVCTNWYDQEGESVVDFCDDIPANSCQGYNTRYGGDAPDGAGTFTPLGTEWTGTVVVTTTSPAGIAALVENNIAGADYTYLMDYNGIPVE